MFKKIIGEGRNGVIDLKVSFWVTRFILKFKSQIQSLLQTRMMQQKTIVIVGGSISGMIAAATFGPYADKVFIIEKDVINLSDDVALTHRAGTPQDQHLHVLLEGGREAIESVLPGFTVLLGINGAQEVDRAKDVQWYHFGLWKTQYLDGGKNYLLTRPLIDKTVRQLLVKKLGDKLEWIFGKRTVGLTCEDISINGVKLDDGTYIPSSLVIDATGRSTSAAKWLNDCGFEITLQSSKVNVELGYSTMIYEYPKDFEFPASVLLVYGGGKNDLKRSGGCLKIKPEAVPGGKGRDNKQYVICTIFGYHDDRPVARTNEEYLRIAKLLPTDDLYNIISQGSPLYEKPIPFYYKSQVRNHWEDVPFLPNGFLSVGDACCSFNPAYAQGMSAAAKGILDCSFLSQELASGKKCSQARKIISNRATVPFLLNSVEDFRFEQTTGNAPIFLKLLQSFNQKAFKAGSKDPEVMKKIYRVFHFQDGITSLFNPAFLLRVLWYG